MAAKNIGYMHDLSLKSYYAIRGGKWWDIFSSPPFGLVLQTGAVVGGGLII